VTTASAPSAPSFVYHRVGLVERHRRGRRRGDAHQEGPGAGAAVSSFAVSAGLAASSSSSAAPASAVLSPPSAAPPPRPRGRRPRPRQLSRLRPQGRRASLFRCRVLVRRGAGIWLAPGVLFFFYGSVRLVLLRLHCSLLFCRVSWAGVRRLLGVCRRGRGAGRSFVRRRVGRSIKIGLDVSFSMLPMAWSWTSSAHIRYQYARV